MPDAAENRPADEPAADGPALTVGRGELERLFLDWFRKALRSGELRLD